MIYVNRKKIKIPDDLRRPSEKIRLEKAKVMSFYTPGKKIKKGFKFDAYNTDGVKEKLKLLFKGKCAYCESEIISVTSADIEHFRPKAMIANPGEKPVVPGYFYLAYDWDNLLLSCEKCNRTGKRNQFPVKPAGKYYINPKVPLSAIEERRRLLLNPCKDKPEKHFKYLENGAMQANMLSKKLPSEMAEISIAVYALNRKELVEVRRKFIKNIRFHIAQIKKIQRSQILALRTRNRELIRLVTQQLTDEFKYLRELKKPENVFSGLAGYVIKAAFRENKII